MSSKVQFRLSPLRPISSDISSTSADHKVTWRLIAPAGLLQRRHTGLLLLQGRHVRCQLVADSPLPTGTNPTGMDRWRRQRLSSARMTTTATFPYSHTNKENSCVNKENEECEEAEAIREMHEALDQQAVQQARLCKEEEEQFERDVAAEADMHVCMAATREV